MNTGALDGFEVINTASRFFQLCDDKDFDGMGSLWTDVVTVDYGEVFPLRGQVEADALKRTMAEVLGSIPLTQHMITTPVVDVDGDTATVRFHLEALHHHPGLGTDERTTDWTLYARNVMGLSRGPDGWRISSEHLTVVHQTGNTDFVSDLTRLASGHSLPQR